MKALKNLSLILLLVLTFTFQPSGLYTRIRFGV